MPRPDYIAKVHAAKYDLRFCSPEQKQEMLRNYRAALEEASERARISTALIEAAIASDFGAWIREEKLPKPPQRNS